MLKIAELRHGDLIKVNDEGVERVGTVVRVSSEENQALVDNGVQEFWYNPAEMSPILLDEEQLVRLGFEKQELENGMKYLKGPFRIVTPRKGDFSHVEMWYREDRRQFHQPLYVHQLQNLHLDMTKVALDAAIV